MSRYLAFISYRHLTPDAEVAKRLHTQIENFSIPLRMRRKLGRNKTGRVFRDQDELPLSADLGDDIRRALEDSEWLICICSPRYLESRWCMEELHFFLSLGRRDRILTVLTEGEPEEAFPKELRYITVNGEVVEKEPLAADVRADTLAEMLKKLKREKLRIIAPMLGVSYDDLRQRARRRRTRIIASAAAAAMMILAGFLGYALFKNHQITEEKNTALTAESRWLAQSAQEALSGGDRMLSMLLSLEALPENMSNPERPVVEDAVATLRSAVISGTADNRYQPVTTVHIPGAESCMGYDNQLYCFSRRIPGYLAGYDMNNGSPCEPQYPLEEEPSWFLFNPLGGGYCVYSNRITRQDGKVVTENIDRRQYVNSGGVLDYDYKLAAMDMSVALLQKWDGVFLRYSYLSEAYLDYADEPDDSFRLFDVRPIKIKGGGDQFLLAGYLGSQQDPDGHQAILRVKSDVRFSDSNIEQRYYLDGKIARQKYGKEPNYYIEQIDVSCDGRIIAGAGTENEYICFWNVSQPEMAAVWSLEKAGEHLTVGKIAFSPTNSDELCILTYDGQILLYDCRTESVRLTIRTGLNHVTDFMWNADGTRLLLTCSDDRARLVSAADGREVQTLEAGMTLKKAMFANSDIRGNSSNDKYIVLQGEEDLGIYVLVGSEKSSPVVSILPDYTYTLRQSTSSAEMPLDRINISADGKTIWNMRSDGLYVLDAETCEVRKKMTEGFAEESYSGTQGTGETVSLSGRVIVDRELVFLASGGAIQVYDPETLERKAVLRGIYPHLFKTKYYNNPEDAVRDRSEESGLHYAAVSPDGKYIAAASGRPGWSGFQWDPSVFLYRSDTFEELWHTGLDSGGDTGDRHFDFAADWEENIGLYSEFLGNGEKILVCYVYDPYGGNALYRRGTRLPEKPVHLAFEVRDSGTGEVETTYYLPYETDRYYILAEQNLLLAQDSGMVVHLMNLETGEEIVSFEKDSRIHSYEADGQSLRIRYRIKGMKDIATKGSEIFYHEGSVKEVNAEGLFRKIEADGVFGGQPYIAENDGLYQAETGKALLTWREDEYLVLRSWDDGSRILCFMPYFGEDTTKSKQNRDGSIVIIRCADAAELREIALQILDGRELTEEQKETYFLKQYTDTTGDWRKQNEKVQRNHINDPDDPDLRVYNRGKRRRTDILRGADRRGDCKLEDCRRRWVDKAFSELDII